MLHCWTYTRRCLCAENFHTYQKKTTPCFNPLSLCGKKLVGDAMDPECTISVLQIYITGANQELTFCIWWKDAKFMLSSWVYANGCSNNPGMSWWMCDQSSTSLCFLLLCYYFRLDALTFTKKEPPRRIWMFPSDQKYRGIGVVFILWDWLLPWNFTMAMRSEIELDFKLLNVRWVVIPRARVDGSYCFCILRSIKWI